MGDVDVRTAVLTSGLTVPYAEVGNSAGEPVVLVHAYAESWRYFEVVLKQLPASIHGCALTQRGHGDADKPAHGYLPEDFAADITGFMDALGVSRVVPAAPPAAPWSRKSSRPPSPSASRLSS